jgi:hypothetical protein
MKKQYASLNRGDRYAVFRATVSSRQLVHSLAGVASDLAAPAWQVRSAGRGWSAVCVLRAYLDQLSGPGVVAGVADGGCGPGDRGPRADCGRVLRFGYLAESAMDAAPAGGGVAGCGPGTGTRVRCGGGGGVRAGVHGWAGPGRDRVAAVLWCRGVVAGGARSSRPEHSGASGPTADVGASVRTGGAAQPVPDECGDGGAGPRAGPQSRRSSTVRIQVGGRRPTFEHSARRLGSTAAPARGRPRHGAERAVDLRPPAGRGQHGRDRPYVERERCRVAGSV